MVGGVTKRTSTILRQDEQASRQAFALQTTSKDKLEHVDSGIDSEVKALIVPGSAQSSEYKLK